MKIIDLPNRITDLLEELNAPERLKKHLQIVHSTANDLISQFKQKWPLISFNEELVLLGAGTHDIGKTEITSELFESGKKHELRGEQLLIEYGFTENEARFAFTHGNWQDKNVKLEDLVVALADKVWKGKRVDALEEKLGQMLAENLTTDYWEIYTELDQILEKLASGADERLTWQGQ